MEQQIEIPEEVLRFILSRIDTVPHLETLLLLWENPSMHWTEEQVSTRVYVGREQAHAILQDLERGGFVVPAAEGYRYDAAWDTGEVLPKVSATYRRHLVYVANLIHSKASSAVREFARAFQFKKGQ